LDFLGAKDDGGAGNNWSYKMCKASVSANKPTFSYFTGLPCHPASSVKALKGNQKWHRDVIDKSQVMTKSSEMETEEDRWFWTVDCECGYKLLV